jgi:hypothetical protein
MKYKLKKTEQLTYQVDPLFEVQSGLNGLKGGSPFILNGFDDVLQDNAASPHVLVLDELHGVLSFLDCVIAEDLGKSG